MEQAVNLDRKAYIESVLYKTMKKEKIMPKARLLAEVHAGLIFPQPMAKVEACLQTLLLRGLLEEQRGVAEQGEDVEMEAAMIRFAD